MKDRAMDNLKTSTDTDQGPRYFPRASLQLRNDESGAQYWSISLNHTQLTYFEVGSHCKFEGHRHPSEQITLVLEGELFFETMLGTTELGVGEVMTIPANVHHAVYTRSQPAKAVDAWSPVNKRYAEGR